MALELIDLPDDCLYEIFKYLSVDEMGHCAATCTRLKKIAFDIVGHHMGGFDFDAALAEVAGEGEGEN